MGKVHLFGFYFPLLFVALAVVEVCLITGSVILASTLRFDDNLTEVYYALGPVAYRAILFAIVMLLSLAAMGLYQTHLREGFAGQMVRVAVAVALGGVILALLYYVVPVLYIGRGVTALASLCAIVTIAGFRLAFFRLVDMESLKPRVLIFGAGEKATWVCRRLRNRNDRCGFRLIGFVDTGSPRLVSSNDFPVFKLDQPLHVYARRHWVDQIVVAVDDRRNSLPMQDLLRCRLGGIEVLDLPTFVERETGTVALELTDPSWLVFGQGFRRGIILAWLKRGLDIIVSAALLVAFSPVMLLTIIAIKLEDGLRAPIMYFQIRVGEQGRLFKLYKLRSMRVDAERESGACWARSNDDRVTRVGRVIRKLRIDELPQVVNVLRGDMSFVGPRPERPEFTLVLEQRIRYYRERCTVKPGITGWAQLRYPYGASDDDSREKLKYDLFYIKNHNMLFDVLILLQTVEVVFFGKGAR